VTDTRLTALATHWHAAVEPRESGLPNWRVVAWYPALVALVLGVLTALRIGGTSSGVFWATFGQGTDPRLLAGVPRAIRSDEWLVNQTWTVSQFQWGFPAVNPTFPGGLDVSVAQEVPTLDGSVIFRPHSWGYFLGGLDFGAAWFWWLPGLALAVGAYLMFVTFAPRRPVTGALLATAVFFFPLFQWIWGPNLLWPAAWTMLVIAALRWLLRDERRHVRWAWAALVGYLAVTTALGLYVPFIIPCVLLLLAVAIGALLEHRRETRERPLRVLGRIAPLLVAAAGAGAVLAAWAAAHASTLDAINSTVYPGFRSIPSGDLYSADRVLAGTAAAAFGGSLNDDTAATVIGSSASDAATVPLIALFAVPGLIILLVRGWRRDRRLDALSIAVLALMALILAYQLIPGLDVLGRVLLLDRVTPTRFRILLAVLVPLSYALVLRHVDSNEQGGRRNVWPIALASALALLASTWALVWIVRSNPELLDVGPWWPLMAVLIAVAAAAMFVRRLVTVSATALFVVALGTGAGANPLYVGVFDLTETEIGQAVHEIAEEPGAWVAVGPAEVVAVMMESGVVGYSGFQTYPPREMWSNIDPDGEYEEIWNQLGHVRWEFAEGEPVVQLYRRGIIVTSFDACSDFAREHVRFVLSASPMPGECGELIRQVDEGSARFWIYEVTP
jgi:hypothetical protein